MVDAANAEHPEQMREVQRVLAEIGAQDIPQVLVFNKLDAIDETRRPRQLRDHAELEGRSLARVFVSARDGSGLAALRAVLSEAAGRHAGAAAAPLETAPGRDQPPMETPSAEGRP